MTSTGKMKYVYHINKDFAGKYLLPLSDLEKEYPKIYKQEISKYKGREGLPKTRIDILECQWQDCVMFSTLNILDLFTLQKLLGVPGAEEVDELSALRFDIADLEKLPDVELCIYDDDVSPKNQKAYSQISSKKYQELETIPAETVKYYADSAEKKERPLLFSNIPHLFVKGKVPLSLGEIISLKKPKEAAVKIPVKLAMFRSNDQAQCPYGLPIPFGCQRAGKSIASLTRLDQGGSAEENIGKITSISSPEACLFNQTEIPPGNGEEFVECSAPEGSSQKLGPRGSPFFYRPLAGVGAEALNTIPLGYYNDNSVDRGYYYGNYSIESISSDPNMGLNSYKNRMKDDQGTPINTMTNAKTAQMADLDGIYIDPDELDRYIANIPKNDDEISVDLDSVEDVGDLQVDITLAPESDEEELFLQSQPEVSGTIEVESDEGYGEEDFNFSLPLVPGGADQSEIEEEEVEEEPTEVDEDELNAKDDPWKWTVPKFLKWLKGKLDGVPQHSGRDIAGIERAISYLERLLKECSKAAKQDHDNEIDVDKLEQARDQMYNGIENLEKRLDQIKSKKNPKKRKKKASDEFAEMVKEGARPIDVQVNVSLFISHIARTVMEACIQQGRDAEDVFRYLVKKYDLDDREKVQVVRLLDDSQFGTYVDWGKYGDDFVEIDGDDGLTWSQNKQN